MVDSMEEIYRLFLDSTGVCTDTRKIKQGCLFVSLKGPNFNANEFASQALDKGAKFALVDEPEFVTQSVAALIRLLSHYERANHGYLSRRAPFREDMAGDYDQLDYSEIVPCIQQFTLRKPRQRQKKR